MGSGFESLGAHLYQRDLDSVQVPFCCVRVARIEQNIGVSGLLRVTLDTGAAVRLQPGPASSSCMSLPGRFSAERGEILRLGQMASEKESP